MPICHASRAAAAVLFAWLCASFVPAHADSGVDGAAVDGTVAEWLTSTGAPSVSIAIVKDGRLAYAKAYDRNKAGFLQRPGS